MKKSIIVMVVALLVLSGCSKGGETRVANSNKNLYKGVESYQVDRVVEFKLDDKTEYRKSSKNVDLKNKSVLTKSSDSLSSDVTTRFVMSNPLGADSYIVEDIDGDATKVLMDSFMVSGSKFADVSIFKVIEEILSDSDFRVVSENFNHTPTGIKSDKKVIKFLDGDDSKKLLNFLEIDEDYNEVIGISEETLTGLEWHFYLNNDNIVVGISPILDTFSEDILTKLTYKISRGKIFNPDYGKTLESINIKEDE